MFLNELKAIWARLDGGQRMVVTSVLFASLVGLGAIFWYSSQPDYVELRTGDQMQEAHDALDAASIPMVADGDVLRIDRDDFGRATALLKMKGLTGSSAAADPSALSGMMLDRQTREAMLADGKRKSAEAAVVSLDDVMNVDVAYTKPKLSAFRSEDALNKPSATASIRLRAGATFLQVAPHVASLVSSATGVPLEFVNVVDKVTHRSWTHDPNTAAGNMDQFLSNQRSQSEEKTRRAQEFLDRAYPGLTVVTVSVELNNMWEKGRDLLTPEEQVLESDKQQQSRTENGVRPGDPSVAASSGQTGAPQTVTTSRDDTSDRVFKTDAGNRDWGMLSPGVKRITSAVLVDRSLERDVPAIIASLEDVIGKDLDRDPPTKYLVTEFPTPEPFEMETASAPGIIAVTQGPGLVGLLRQWGPTIGQVLGVLLVLWFLRGMLKRAAPVPPKGSDTGQAAAVSPDDAEKQIRGEIEKAIADDPAAISRLLEGWLTEQKA